MKLAPLLFRLLLPCLALLAAGSTSSAAHPQGDASEEVDVRNIASFKLVAMVSAYACTLHDTILVAIHFNRSTSLSNCVSLLHLILSCPLNITKTLTQYCFIHFYDYFFVNQELRRLRETHSLQGKCQCKYSLSWSESSKHTRTKNESNCSRKSREQIRSASRSCLRK
jgi:hypothetical protein